MQPTDSFWSGVGESVGTSPGWLIVGVIAIIGVLFIWAKYVSPSYERIKMRELDIREREAQNDADRIKANEALAEQMQGVRESNDVLATQSAALFAGIEESKVRSRDMGATVSDTNSAVHHIRDTTDSTADKVDEIHKLMVLRAPEGTD